MPRRYTLSLHDALPIYALTARLLAFDPAKRPGAREVIEVCGGAAPAPAADLDHLARRSEEHTSELQSLTKVVCRLLLEKKNTSIHSLSFLRRPAKESHE